MGAGESWKKKREAMGKSVDEMSRELRVGAKYIRAIEDGRWDGWPVRVFSAGFIRAYARKLSMDPEPVLSEYYRFVDKKADAEPPLQVRPEWLEREKERGSRRTIYTGAAAAVLLVGILVAWYSTRFAPRPPRAPQLPAATAPSAPAAGHVAAEPGGPAPGEAGGNAASAGPPQAAGAMTRVAGAGPAGGEPVPGAPAAAAGPAAGSYKLFLDAKETTWVLYARDDEEPTDVILQPGDRFSIEAQRKLYLKIGNAGGVQATLNGKPLPPFGEAGKVAVYQLGPH
ncbi:MAG: helix-turn-helix domain-containing protein [Gemmatimonadota bacterium]